MYIRIQLFDAWLRVYILPHHCLFSGLWDPDSIWFKHMSCVMTPVRSVSAREIQQQRHFNCNSIQPCNHRSDLTSTIDILVPNLCAHDLGRVLRRAGLGITLCNLHGCMLARFVLFRNFVSREPSYNKLVYITPVTVSSSLKAFLRYRAWRYIFLEHPKVCPSSPWLYRSIEERKIDRWEKPDKIWWIK